MIEKIRDQIDNDECLILTDKIDIKYAIGLEVSGYLFITREEMEIITSNFYRNEELEAKTDFYSDKAELLEKFEEKIGKYSPKTFLTPSGAKFPKDFEHKETNLLKELRETKTDKEIEKIRESVKITEKAFREVEKHLFSGLTERELVEKIHGIFVQNNAYDSFIQTQGTALVHRNCLRPHRKPVNVEIEDEDLVIVDIGAEKNGYCADMTRTYCRNPSERKEQLHETVNKIQNEIIEIIEPGLKISDIREKEIELVKKNGYKPEKHLIHSTGHGIGLQVHEKPSINLETDKKLKEGMVLAVEPALYVPGVGGCRIEDDVLITSNGAERLSKIPRDLST